MLLIPIVLNVVALFATSGDMLLPFISLGAAIWGYGIASNFRGDPQNMPNYVMLLFIGSTVVGIIMIIVGAGS